MDVDVAGPWVLGSLHLNRFLKRFQSWFGSVRKFARNRLVSLSEWWELNFEILFLAGDLSLESLTSIHWRAFKGDWFYIVHGHFFVFEDSLYNCLHDLLEVNRLDFVLLVLFHRTLEAFPYRYHLTNLIHVLHSHPNLLLHFDDYFFDFPHSSIVCI